MRVGRSTPVLGAETDEILAEAGLGWRRLPRCKLPGRLSRRLDRVARDTFRPCVSVSLRPRRCCRLAPRSRRGCLELADLSHPRRRRYLLQSGWATRA